LFILFRVQSIFPYDKIVLMKNMGEESAKTLAAYEAHALEYVKQYPYHEADFSESWIEKSLRGVAKDAEILEIGSGVGVTAKFIESLGYKIQVSDAAKSFVKYLRENGFPNARQFNLITDEFWQNFDYILADAVLLHFTKDEVREVLKKVYDALNPGGIFEFSFMLGEGERWQNRLGAERYFKDWQINEVQEILDDVDFDAKIEISGNYNDKNSERRWICVTVQKGQK